MVLLRTWYSSPTQCVQYAVCVYYFYYTVCVPLIVFNQIYRFWGTKIPNQICLVGENAELNCQHSSKKKKLFFLAQEPQAAGLYTFFRIKEVLNKKKGKVWPFITPHCKLYNVYCVVCFVHCAVCTGLIAVILTGSSRPTSLNRSGAKTSRAIWKPISFHFNRFRLHLKLVKIDGMDPNLSKLITQIFSYVYVFNLGPILTGEVS